MNSMNSLELSVDSRELQYGRLTSAVLATLRKAVGRRISEGASQGDIADRIGCHKSLLSRVLSGRTSNVTLRTVSDVLWACDYEPEVFDADPLETLCPNQGPVSRYLIYSTKTERNGEVTPVFMRFDAGRSASPEVRTEIYWSCPKTLLRL